MSNSYDLIVIGGGAAGFYAAITAGEANPTLRILILEKGRSTLQKVKISGGGRCNVTHQCFEPDRLAANYPRGFKELRGAFHRWQPSDTVRWFGEHQVELKAEADGRMFPISNQSQTIIDCFHAAAKRLRIEVRTGNAVERLERGTAGENDNFVVATSGGQTFQCRKLVIATGSSKSAHLLGALKSFGHTTTALAPSLFAFNTADKRTSGLSGLSVDFASICLEDPKSAQYGPILITHKGLSGPAVLRLSAWQARNLKDCNYHFPIYINWLGDVSESTVRQKFAQLRAGKTLVKTKVFDAIPRRLWERLVNHAQIGTDMKWAQLSKPCEKQLIEQIVRCQFEVLGKTTNKDEFVTCGGISLKEINLKTLESRLVKDLYFAGECLDIDGITGGFNFQAAWTTGRLAGLAIADTHNP